MHCAFIIVVSFVVSFAYSAAAFAHGGIHGGSYRGNGGFGVPEHGQRVEQARHREHNVMHGDSRVSAFVAVHGVEFRAAYRPFLVGRYNEFYGWYPRWGSVTALWHRHGFYGGFHYPLRPVYDIDQYFFNPLVFWLWAERWDDHYYETWYGSEWYSNPVLQTHFARPGVFFPTESMRDLALGLSVLPASEQGALRLGLNDLVNKLQLELLARAGEANEFGRNDVVVTNFQILDGAIVLEGFAGNATAQPFAFKALLSLEDPALNTLFVPAGARPTEGEISFLSSLNERIRLLGGVVESAPSGEVRRGE